MMSVPTAQADDGWSLDLQLESRTFFEAPADGRQKPEHFGGSLAIYPEWAGTLGEDGRQEVVFEGFARGDTSDSERTHADVRDQFWRYPSQSYEVNLGIKRVFWGVTEAAHLVDIVNQSDFVENPDNEDKLGQPMARLAWIIDPGVLEFYLLPYFRERTFPGIEGRLRPFLRVDTDRPIYESADEERHLDGALRYAQSFGGWDFGFSFFDGTGREPRLLVESDFLVTASPDTPLECQQGTVPDPLAEILAGVLDPDCEQYYSITPTNSRLRPAYDQVRQYGLELQRLSEGWFLKLEAIRRESRAQSYSAAVGGFEYTFGGVWESPVDLTLVMEYLWDERGSLDPDSPQAMALQRIAEGGSFTVEEARSLQGLKPRSFSPVQNDLFVGSRIALNDEDGTEALIGAIVDLEEQTTLASIEASRRLDEDWKLAIESRWFGSPPVTDPLWSFRRDGYLTLELTRFF